MADNNNLNHNQPSAENSAKAVNTAQTPEKTHADDIKTKKAMDDVAGILDEVRQQTSLPEESNKSAEKVTEAADNGIDEMIDITSMATPAVSAADNTGKAVNKTNSQNALKENNVTKNTNAVAASVTAVAAAKKDTKKDTKEQAVIPPKKDKKPSNHLFAKIFCGLVVSAVLLGAAFYSVYKANPEVTPTAANVKIPGGTVKEPEDKVVFLKGIKVAGIDVSGKTIDEAKSLLAVRGTALIPGVSLTVDYNGVSYSYKKDDFDFTYDINQAVDKAYEYSKSVTDSGTNDIITNAPGDSSVKVDTDNNTVDFLIDYKVTQSSVQKVIKRIAKKVDIPCVEPHVSKFDTTQKKNSKRYTFKEGSTGTAIDQDELITDAIAAFNKGEKEVTLTAKSYESKPTLNMADVKKATKLIGKFSTISTNSSNANSNMATALAAINGKILEPGDTLSFNDCTGNSNLSENGYLPAGVIEGGEMTSGIGGGICQAATTLYNAAIMANMEIVEREPHLWCSYYVYGGLDATIDWGNIDLKVKNNSKYQMFFRCWMDGVELNVEIYGWQSPDFDEVRTESELDWSSSEAYGYLAYRVFYKNGKEVKREDLPYSQYSLSNGGGIRGADPGDVSTKLKQPE